MQSQMDLKNLTLAFVLSVSILFAWQLTQPKPAPIQPTKPASTGATVPAVDAAAPTTQTREAALTAAPRLPLSNGKLHGSIALQGKGLRLDDLTLAKYRETVDPASPEVTLLSPATSQHQYFADFGWTGADILLPNDTTVWKAEGSTLAPGKPVILRWTNPQGILFTITLLLDEHYMFTVTQSVLNKSGQIVSVTPYGLVNREWHPDHKMNYILHEGPIGVFNKTLDETSYTDLEKDKSKGFTSVDGGWMGISDKYWFTAIIPAGQDPIDARYAHYTKGDQKRFQVDYRSHAQEIAPGGTIEHTVRFYAGPKEITLLDSYMQSLSIPLFDRAVDFGVLYILTRPIFLALQYLFGLVGNFGVAILILTVGIRLALFPLANKSYVSLAHMRALQPKMQELKERHGEDRMRFQQELVELYRKEKVNPMAGCLPILLQIPVFFALYKVLYVTIEMRHAPFFGWIHDLSAPDPTTIFNLFGLIPFTPPQFLMIGALPLMMTVTMIIQQKLNPAPSDPVQAKVMKMLPYIFLFLFATFPAGLVLYWTWSNTLSILQQWLIIKRHDRTQARKEARKLASTPKQSKKA